MTARPLSCPFGVAVGVGYWRGARFTLDFQAGATRFRDGPATETWGVNGTHLGPTLRASRDDEFEIALHNGVDETTTMHWHGMHLPASMDGGPHQPVAPGETWRPTWTIDQSAATLWYHPHPHGETADHVYRGVAGMFIVDDDEAAALDLPHTYFGPQPAGSGPQEPSGHGRRGVPHHLRRARRRHGRRDLGPGA